MRPDGAPTRLQGRRHEHVADRRGRSPGLLQVDGGRGPALTSTFHMSTLPLTGRSARQKLDNKPVKTFGFLDLHQVSRSRNYLQLSMR